MRDRRTSREARGFFMHVEQRYVGSEQYASTHGFAPAVESDPEYTARDVFFNYLREHAHLFPPGLSLKDFYSNERLFDVPHYLRVEGFTFLKAEQLADRTLNPINFVAGTAKAGLVHGDGLAFDFEHDEARRSMEEVFKNLKTFVSEHPIAEMQKKETQRYQWELDQGEWRMRGQFGFMDEIIDTGIASSQAASFEKPRYQINKRNYEMIRADRIKAMNDPTYVPEVFVEFSPSPVLTDEARSRGYVGNSCIFVFRFDPETKTETVEQLWLKADWLEFGGLIKQLKGKDISPSDVAIMEASDFFDPDDLFDIGAFVASHHGGSAVELDPSLSRELEAYLRRELGEVLTRGAVKLVHGQDVAEELEFIAATLVIAQEMFKRKLPTGLVVKTADVNEQDFLRATKDAAFRILFMKQNEEKMEFSGCGGGVVKKKDGTSSAYGNSGSLFGMDYQFDKEGTCKVCKQGPQMLGPCGICEGCDGHLRNPFAAPRIQIYPN